MTKLVTEYVLKSGTKEPESNQDLPTTSFPLGFLLPQLSTFVSEDHNGISTLLISYSLPLENHPAMTLDNAAVEAKIKDIGQRFQVCSFALFCHGLQKQREDANQLEEQQSLFIKWHSLLSKTQSSPVSVSTQTGGCTFLYTTLLTH